MMSPELATASLITENASFARANSASIKNPYKIAVNILKK
jgi:hypothetical protein